MPLYKERFRSFEPGKNLPRVSTLLDAVRAYQFEVIFRGLPPGAEVPGQSNADLTLAAKQVSPIGGTLEDIVVDRVNDKVFYPGKFSPDEVTITFDNLLAQRTTPLLWKWFTQVYNPLTGDANARPFGRDTFKCNRLLITELDGTSSPVNQIELYGVYPKSFKFSEKNYSTNEFSTIEVSFRFDFMDQYRGNPR
jgi:hypothetical protein